MNHLTTLMTFATSSSLQKLLNIYNDFGLANCISFNFSKSIYIVFSLLISDMYFNFTIMKRSFDIK